MSKARGKAKQLLIAINEIQTLIGRARGQNQDDQDPHGFQKCNKALEEAFIICYEATGIYDPI